MASLRRSLEEDPELDRLRRRALRGLTDLWFLGSVILKLGMEEARPRPREEIEPIYSYVEGRTSSFETRLVAGRGWWPKDFPLDAKWLRALCVPRYLGKTYVILVYLLQTILRRPNIVAGYHCNEKDQAVEGVRLVREWLELPQIEQLYGTHKSRNWDPGKGLISCQRTKGVEKNPTLRALGLDKPLEGKRMDLIVWDDLIGENNYKPEGVIKVERRRAATMPLLKEGGIGLWPCTRWGIMDPMSDGKTFGGEEGILKKWKEGGWDCFGARGFVGAYAVPGDEKFFPHLKRKNAEKTSDGRRLVFPSVWNERSIEEARREMPFGLHASQVLNDPLPEESRNFSQKDLLHFPLYTEKGEFNPILGGSFFVLALDPNKSADLVLGSDRHALVLMALKLLKDPDQKREFWNGYILQWMAGRWKNSDLIDRYFNLVEEFKPRRHFIETNVGKSWVLDPIKKRGRELGFSRLPIEEVETRSISKDDRIIYSLQPAFAYGQIQIAEHLKGGEGEEELLRWMPNQAAHDDMVDVLEIAWSKGTMKRIGGVHTPEGVRKPTVVKSWRRRYPRSGLF